REEGVVTVTDADALPPQNPYMRFWTLLPSWALMFGLLGTFVGLTLSLAEIPVTGEVEAIQKGLSRSIPSMGTAFWTSLSGLLVALGVRIANSWMAASFRKNVVQVLMSCESAVREALENAAFYMGQDGALLRSHSVKEMLWHQNRMLNQSIARVAPQVSESVVRGLRHLDPVSSTSTSGAHLETYIVQMLQQQQQFQNELSQLFEQQNQLLQHLQATILASTQFEVPISTAKEEGSPQKS
ncbi:MAG: MotA/TolQ/ExbB proton channel family protein, partial [Myxococcota bacterium]